MLSILMGLATMFLGCCNGFLPAGGFWGILSGLVSFCLICGGFVAVLAGFSSLKK